MIAEITNTEQLEVVFEHPSFFVFKHSTRCPTSARVWKEVQAFAEKHPDVPVHRVLVIEDRPVSNAIAERLGIVHESPQAILVRGGSPVWDASHGAISADALERAWAEVAEESDQPAR